MSGARLPTPTSVKQDTVAEQLSQDGMLVPLQRVTRLPILQGLALTSQTIAAGANQIAHKLGRKPVGYFATRTTGPGVFLPYADASDASFLIFSATAATVADLWVF